MNLINDTIVKQSDFVQDIYEAQTRAFSFVEYPYILEIISNYGIRSVLDVGTGEGTFINGLAKQIPNVAFTAIDADSVLIQKAQKENKEDNITFLAAPLDTDFSLEKYDLILSRFAVEHMKSAGGFVDEAIKRLNPNGILLITEYWCEYSANNTEDWKLFRKKEIELYEKLGSYHYIPLVLPGIFKESKLQQINSLFRHITPSVADRKDFYDTVKSYVIGYHQMAPDIFTEDIKSRLMSYFQHPTKDDYATEDNLFITHTFGRLG